MIHFYMMLVKIIISIKCFFPSVPSFLFLYFFCVAFLLFSLLQHINSSSIYHLPENLALCVIHSIHARGTLKKKVNSKIGIRALSFFL